MSRPRRPLRRPARRSVQRPVPGRSRRQEGSSLRGSSTVRLRTGLIAMTIVLSIFGVRLFQLQGLDPQSYAARAAASGLVTLAEPAKRGEITDRNGTPLAQSVVGLMIVADPTKTKAHADDIARILSDRLSLDYFDLLGKLRKPKTHFVYLARRVPSTVATSVVEEINRRKLKGIDTRADPVRQYPAQDVGANLVGFLNAAGVPQAGLEQSLNKTLSGKDGTETFEVGGGNRIPLGENTEVKPTDGKDVKLTIDRDVQWYSQRVLRSAVQAVNADSGAAIALDTKTGQILSLADYPTFDANNPGDADTPKDLGSRALGDVYEPGSVEKVLTSSSLIDAGKVTPETRLTIPPQLPVQDRVIHDYFVHDTLKFTLAGVIAQSSNIGTVLAASKFTHGELWSYLKKFQLGERVDIGLPSESRGVVPPVDTWSQVSQATIAFGQGLSVNALQMAAAVNTIANGGEYVTPSLIQGKATTAAGATVGTETARSHRVVSASAASQEAQMMEMVTTEGKGTAPAAAVPGYRTAGKTGTAQEVGKKCRCYDGTLAVSFAGFAPADDPRFTVYVVIRNPRVPEAGGGWIAGPVFRKMMTYLLQKYAVPPTGTPPADLATTWGPQPEDDQ